MVNGTKTWISNGIHGSCFALLVKTDLHAEPRHRGMSMLLAEKGPGFAVGRKLEKLGYKGIDSAELVFQDYRVPVDRLIGGIEGRLKRALSGLELGRINVAARGVGIAQAALDESLRYASPQDVRQADRAAPGDPAQARRYGNAHRSRASADPARGANCMIAATAATWRRHGKLFATEAAMENATEAMRMHGGYGYPTEFPVERLYRDAPLLVIGEGTNEMQRIMIAANSSRGIRCDAPARRRARSGGGAVRRRPVRLDAAGRHGRRGDQDRKSGGRRRRRPFRRAVLSR